jgi:glyoxylase-like metal-dependent hydrolase (beta-lactamase superfamily II)
MTDVQAQVDLLIDERGGRELLLPELDEQAQEITPFIFRSAGSTAAYVVATDDGRVLVNTGKGAEAPHHKRLFDAVVPGPTRYIVTTQGHVDHVGGVSHFRDPGTVYVAHQNNAVCQADDARIAGLRKTAAVPWFKRNYARQAAMVEQSGKSLIQDVPTPDITFAERMRFRVGSMAFELVATPGETIDNCVVWLPQQKICFTSNTFGPLFPHFPNLSTLRGDRNRQVVPWLETLARVRDLQPEMLITGRGEPIVGAELIDACLTRLYEAVDWVHRFTLDGMNSGVDMLTLMRTVELPPHLRVGEGYGKVMWGVRAIWENYTGWFHRRSTTELYPVPALEALAELSAALGSHEVLGRARSHIAAGEPVLAMHLLEAVLAGSPGDRSAIALMVEAHETLLAQTDQKNFWEYGWLTDQIDTWRQRLDAGA